MEIHTVDQLAGEMSDTFRKMADIIDEQVIYLEVIGYKWTDHKDDTAMLQHLINSARDKLKERELCISQGIENGDLQHHLRGSFSTYA